jgi:hypothetical protein
VTYATQANKVGKQPVQIVEIYGARCSQVYGTSPCLAAIGVTGTDRCYNTTATCQYRSALTNVDKVYRFATQRVDNIQQVGDPPTFPTLMSVKTAATVLTPGKGLGIRASVSITIQDHPWTDMGMDPYVTTRANAADMRGTFWGKWLSRNRYYENRRIDILTGFLTDTGTYDATNFKRRTYIITKISGPSASGMITIEAKDPLKFADGEKAQWPKAAVAVLTSNITNVATTVPITDAALDLVTWWGAGQRYIKIEDEIMLASAATGIGTTTVSLTVTRMSMPSWYDSSQNIQVAHALGASVQPCWLFQNAMVYDIVYFILNTVAGIPSGYLPLATWTAEINNGFQYLSFNALLVEPVAAKDLLTEITQLCVMVWWHERDQKVYMRGLRFTSPLGAQVNDDTSIVANSLSVSEDTSNLMTQHWLYYDLSWPLANMDLLRSYRNVDVRANLTRETSDEYGKAAIRPINSRWLSRAGKSIAVSVGATTLRQYQDVRKIVSWMMDPKDDAYWVGDTVGLSTKFIQADDGSNANKNILITQVEEVFGSDGYLLKYTGVELYAYVRVGLITYPSPTDPTPSPGDYTAASDADKNKYAFICYNTPVGNEKFLDGKPAYQIT